MKQWNWLGLAFLCLVTSAYAEGPLDCRGTSGDLFPVLPEDRKLEAFPPGTPKDRHLTSCHLCGHGKAQGYFYNLTQDQRMKIVGDTFVYFYDSDQKLIASRSAYVRSTIPFGRAELVVDVEAPSLAVDCKFSVDVEKIRFLAGD